MATKFDELLEALDLDNKEFIPTGLRDTTAKDVLDSVIGQLSDGIWENSPGMNKYWQHADIDFIDGEINIIVDNSWNSGFKGKSPEEIKKWFAKKVKQIIKEEGLDWKRDNEESADYMHGDVRVKDAYRVYDKLLGRIDRITESLDSMWIIIPTERRYDDLTASDYDEFINKYGTFNNQKDCFDKIEELAPNRWDAFIPMRLEGVNESLNDKYLYDNKYSNLDDKTFFKKIKSKIKYACQMKAINVPEIIQDSWGITVKSDDFSNFKTPEEFDEFAKLCGFKEPADIGYDHISFNYDWQYPEQFDESLNESSQNKRDEFFRYCLSNDMDYELICDILVDKLDDKTLSSIMKDMEEYNDFTMDESLK